MRAKAVERLQRIHELFPREEERNPELQKLYIAAGIGTQICEAGSAPGGDSGARACEARRGERSADDQQPGASGGYHP